MDVPGRPVQAYQTDEELEEFERQQPDQSVRKAVGAIRTVKNALKDIMPDMKVVFYATDEEGAEIQKGLGDATVVHSHGFWDRNTKTAYFNASDLRKDTPFHEPIHGLIEIVKECHSLILLSDKKRHPSPVPMQYQSTKKLLAMENTLKITCPHCGNQFSPNAAIEGHLRAHMEKEYEGKLANSRKAIERQVQTTIQAEYQERIDLLQQDVETKAQRLKELTKREESLNVKEKELDNMKENIELEFRKQFLQKEKELRAELESTAAERARLENQEEISGLKRTIEAMELSFKKATQTEIDKVRSEEQLKIAELEGKLEEQTRLASEMKRKIEQGSMQTQGEVLELELESLLRATFPFDTIREVPKGVSGCDTLQEVRNAFQQSCGVIAYETKRTKSFSMTWIAKFKEDMRLAKAEIGILVTEAMPKDMTHFGLVDGVWVCSFAEVGALAFVLRESLLKLSLVRSQQENRADKMCHLYEYLTSNEFAQSISSIITGFGQLKAGLDKEKRVMQKVWKEREKQIELILNNTITMHGTIRGIGGSSVKEIDDLSLDGLLLAEKLLEE